MPASRPTLALIVLALAATALACGGSDPIADVAAANAAVAAQQKQVDSAADVVKQREKDVADAEKGLAEARKQLAEEERELERLASEVDRTALDTALFRAVQQRLLEDRELASVAITASVTGGVVTLSGTVDRQELSDRAAEVAGQTRGVERVENRVRMVAVR